MGRWEPGAAGRLQTAAVKLFVDQGFAATTVPQIAARAGLTTRTFFRHYADKRDVLFAGEEELPEVVAQVFAHAAPDLGPLDVVVHGLQTVVAPRLQAHHAELRIRRDILRSDASLLERDASKLASLGRAATTGFADRGLSPLHAGTAAALAVGIYDVALNLWLDGDGTPTFVDTIATARDAVDLLAPHPPIGTPIASGH